MYRIAQNIATLFCSGYFPIFPGTVGSFLTLPFVMLVGYLYGFWGILITSVLLFFIGTWSVAYMIRDIEDHDPSYIVVDEAMGQFFTFILVSFKLQAVSPIECWKLYCAGFILFRFFDAVKLHPARWADSSLHNSWGVMLDDFFAACYAAILLWIFALFL